MSRIIRKVTYTKVKYTLFIVTRNAEDHYPVILANNGKVPFNESVKRARTLEDSFAKFMLAVENGEVTSERITHADFKKKYPSFAKNAGPRKKKK